MQQLLLKSSALLTYEKQLHPADISNKLCRPQFVFQDVPEETLMTYIGKTIQSFVSARFYSEFAVSTSIMGAKLPDEYRKNLFFIALVLYGVEYTCFIYATSNLI